MSASSPKMRDKKMSLKSLVGKKLPLAVQFMDMEVTINKLSVSDIMKIQAMSDNKDADETTQGLETLLVIIRASLVGHEELTDEEFQSFPMSELTLLSEQITKHSGLGGEEKSA